MGPTGTERDTYVAVLERAPKKNEEVMTEEVQCQQMVYLSVHGPRVGKGPTARMAAYNDGKVCILRLVAIYCHINSHNLIRPSDELSYVGITGATIKRVE